MSGDRGSRRRPAEHRSTDHRGHHAGSPGGRVGQASMGAAAAGSGLAVDAGPPRLPVVPHDDAVPTANAWRLAAPGTRNGRRVGARLALMGVLDIVLGEPLASN